MALIRRSGWLVVFLALALVLSAGLVAAQRGGTYTVKLTLGLEPGAPWAVEEIWHLPWSTETDPEPTLAEADGRLIFRDAGGDIVHSRLVERWVLCNGDCHEVDGASSEIPAQPDAVRAELYTIDPAGNALELKAVKERSPAMPEVEILNPRPGATLTDGMTITWRAADADGDPLLFNVLYRPSVGFWEQLPLDVRTTATELVFRRYDLPADTNATIAIQANDGFNTVEASVSGLQLVGNLPPEIVVSSPHDGDTFHAGSNIMLLAYADDPEDGELPVTWTSDLDGVLPDDPNWSTGSVGRHILTASATDSGGLTASESMRIYIGVSADPPWMVYLPALTTGVGAEP